MIEAFKKKFIDLIMQQAGFTLPAVLAIFALGSLIIVPSISYVATNLKAGMMAEEEFRGILAADAGVEDALWKIENDILDEETLPYEYQITGVNGLSVDVTIGNVEQLGGIPLDEGGGHVDWITANATATYDAGIWSYELSIYNDQASVKHLTKIFIDFPSGLEYIPDSTSGDITTDDPNLIIGSPATGITLLWEWEGSARPELEKYETKYHRFELNGSENIKGVEGHGFVLLDRTDVGSVWIGEIVPYTIIAQARDDSAAVLGEIRAGVWGGSGSLEISCWQVIP
jgi:hypothetical protein